MRGKTIAVLGLTFKPNTDDMREAPSIAHRSRRCRTCGAKVRAYDPEGMEQAKQMLSRRRPICDGAYACAEGADALVIVTEWEQFRALDFERLKIVMERRCWSTCATSTGRRRSPARLRLRSVGRPKK